MRAAAKLFAEFGKALHHLGPFSLVSETLACYPIPEVIVCLNGGRKGVEMVCYPSKIGISD